ncbi:MAG TPA: hypothetical protein VM677_02980 [Actinokineospora sp.]|nr:hypothetical protein [Actinokineospora sp.]
MPAGSTAFGKESGGNRWVAPVLVGLVAVGLIIGAIFFLSNPDDGQNPQNPQTTGPSIPVGPGTGDEPTSSGSKPSTRKTLPSISVVAPPSN